MTLAATVASTFRRTYNHFHRRLEYAKINTENQLWWNHYCRLISPDKIVVNEDNLNVDGMLVECIIVGLPQLSTDGYPNVLKASFLNKILNIKLEGAITSYSFGLVPIPTHEAQQLLQEALFRNKVNQQTSKDDNSLGMATIVQQLDARDIAAVIEKLHNNEEKMFHTAFIITIWAEDERAMKKAKSKIKVVMNSHRVYGSFPSRKVLPTYIAGQAYPKYEGYTFVEMISSLASRICPTKNPDSSLSTGSKGLYVGNDRRTGKEIIVDLEARAAQHMCLVGNSGSGKTYFTLGILGRLYAMGRNVVYITVKDDGKTRYLDMAKYFAPDSCIINVGPEGKNINPLQFMHSGEGLSSIEAAAIYDRQKIFIYNFFKMWFKETLSPNMEAYLDKSLNTLYIDRFGILRSDSSTWNKPFPTMKHLIQVWEDDKNSENKDDADSAAALIRKTYAFGENGGLNYMNRPTDIDLSKGFTVIDLVKVPDVIKEAMNAFVTGMMTTYFSTNNKRGTTIAIDEGGAFLRDKQLSELVLKILTQGRSYDLGLIFATQEFSDLEKAKLSEEFMTNTPVKIVLGYELDKKAISYIKDFLMLDDSAVKDLNTDAKGQGIIKIGDSHAPLAFVASEKEDAIIKGRYNLETDENLDPEKEKTATALGGRIKDEFVELAKLNKVVFADWVEGEDPDYTLQKIGYTKYNPHNLLKRGNGICWAHSSLVTGTENIGNQTQDHYFSVLKLAGILIALGFKNVAVHHHDDVDVSAELNGQSYGFEYEHPESHDTQDIIDKKRRGMANYNHLLFIGSTANEEQLAYAAGDDYVRRRGDQLKGWLDDVAAGKTPRTVTRKAHQTASQETEA